MKVLVLGANGFVGRRIVASLVERHGPDAVFAGVRRPGAVPTGVEARIVDACDPASVEAAAAGASHIVNAVMGSRRAIAESARSGLAVARKRDLAGLIHFSSIAVYGARTGRIDEDAPQGEGVDAYGAAKVAAERLLAAGDYRRVSVLRPGLVHGPGSALWTERIGRLLMAGRLGHLGAAGEGTCPLVHVDDVAAFVTALLAAGEAGHRAFNLVAPDPPSWNDYLTRFGQALGTPVRRISPAGLRAERIAAYPLRVAEHVGGRLGIAVPPPITPGLARLFDRRADYVSDAAHALLPRWRDLGAALAQDAAWLRGAMA
jgi:nucleoside-diphosphate-sugar epimerase